MWGSIVRSLSTIHIHHAVFENGMGGKKVAWVVGMGGKSGMGGKKLSTIQLEMDL
jgi:hypothetical protein